jgi:hypothetical protein
LDELSGGCGCGDRGKWGRFKKVGKWVRKQKFLKKGLYIISEIFVNLNLLQFRYLVNLKCYYLHMYNFYGDLIIFVQA